MNSIYLATHWLSPPTSQIRFPSFVLHVAPVSNIVHITRRSPRHKGAEITQSIVATPVDATERKCIRRQQPQESPRFRKWPRQTQIRQNVTSECILSTGWFGGVHRRSGQNQAQRQSVYRARPRPDRC